MRISVLWIVAGILGWGLVACNVPAAISPSTSTAGALPVNTPPVPASTAPVSPLPAAALSTEIFGSPPPTPAASPATGEGQVPAKPDGTIEDAAVVYRRSGGLTGRSQTWAIYLDGRIMAPTGQVRQVTPAQVTELMKKIEALGFFAMEDRYMPQNTCCDRFTHTLTVRRGGQAKTVTTLDATPNAPAELWEAINAVARLATSGS